MNAYLWFYRCAVFSAAMGVACLVVPGQKLKEMFAYASIIALPAVALTSLGFRAQWKNRGNLSALLAGAIIILGGAAFDMSATLYHSPDLEYEENPIARALMSGGVSTTKVILIGLVAQLLLVFSALMVWVNFLRRIDWYRSEIESSGDVTLLARVIGAPDNSFLSLIGIRIRHDVMVSALGFFVVPVFTYRWYLGLEWFGVVPISRAVVPLSLVLSAFAALLVWGYMISRESRVQSSSLKFNKKE